MAERTQKCMCGREHPISTIGKSIDHETGELLTDEQIEAVAERQRQVNARLREWAGRAADIEKGDVVRYPTSMKLWEVTHVASVPSTEGSAPPFTWLTMRALDGPSQGATRTSIESSVVLYCKAADREARGLS